MFRFFINCYLLKLTPLRGLLLVSLIPAFVYLVAAASQPDRFVVYQKIKIARDAPLAVSSSPSEFVSTEWYLAHQDELFQDAFALQWLSRDLQKELPPQSPMPTEAQLIQTVKNAMSLSYKNALLHVTYKGPDQAMGKIMTAFYAKKVMKKAEDGIKRQELLMAQQAQQQGQVTPVPALLPFCELKGDLAVESDSALWRSERLPLAILLLAAGLAAVLIWIGILEVFDTSFKSERQVARFLHVPVLGCVPNLSRVSKVMSIKI